MEKKRILVVDDEPAFVKVLKTRLEASGYDVITAFDGDEGLKRSRDESPDLILLDIMMPKIDGYTFFIELKKDNVTRGIPVVILTAKPGMKDMFEEEGAKAYIVKPFDPEELLDTIKELIGG